MAETSDKTKKANAPAKPKAAAAGTTTKETVTKKQTVAEKVAVAPVKQTVAEKVTATTPNHEEIARLAQQYWAERGYHDGQAEQDWFRAERELMAS
jgi:hypothetical protein